MQARLNITSSSRTLHARTSTESCLREFLKTWYSLPCFECMKLRSFSCFRASSRVLTRAATEHDVHRVLCPKYEHHIAPSTIELLADVYVKCAKHQMRQQHVPVCTQPLAQIMHCRLRELRVDVGCQPRRMCKLTGTINYCN